MVNFLAHLKRQLVVDDDLPLMLLALGQECRLDLDTFCDLLILLKRNSPLVSICVVQALDLEKAKVLMRFLPQIHRLKKIHVRFESAVAPLKDALMKAFQDNLSLEDVGLEADFLTEEDQEKLKSLCSRNAAHRLATERVKQCVSSDDVLFCTLVGHNGDLLPGGAERKRKHDDL
jgi:hypothetical protein